MGIHLTETKLKAFSPNAERGTGQDRNHTEEDRRGSGAQDLYPSERLNSSDMSFQMCHCGWSKVTTYHGLRTHQGKMGCTPKGMSIPQSDQYTHSYLPKMTYIQSPIKVEEPPVDIFTAPRKPDGEWSLSRSLWGGPLQKDSRLTNSTPFKETVHVSPNFSTPTVPIATETAVLGLMKSLMDNKQQSLQTDGFPLALDFSGNAQALLVSLGSQAYCAAAEVTTMRETNTSWFETPPQPHGPATTARRALDFSSGPLQMGQLPWDLPTTTAQQTAVQPKEKETEAQQIQKMEQLAWNPPTTAAARQTAVQPGEDDAEREREKEREKEREAQKLQKARHDRIRADLRQNIQMREQKMAEVTSSVKACKGRLDGEWLEINSVFSEVMRVVEETRRKALRPLEDRRLRVKKEGQDLVKKLQNEVDRLKTAIDELDKNPHSQVTVLDESWDSKHGSIDGSCSFSTLKAKTSSMIEQIHWELEKLSHVELKRISTFEVDVKLDPTTAHPCLVLSPDGKTVRDGGRSQSAPDAPGRFDLFGSILGLNRLTSGRSYWEVEVGDKPGWDLGVARRDAVRRGRLTLSPAHGYWVTVHYNGRSYAALGTPPVSLSLRGKPRRVGVFVDHEEGLVSFYDAAARSHIHSFTGCSFGGEVVPYFSPHLRDNEKNCGPLIISSVVKQQQQ